MPTSRGIEYKDFRAPKRDNIRAITVTARIDAFLTRLERSNASSAFAIATSEIRELNRTYSKYYVKTALTRYRVAVGAKFGSTHPVMRYLHAYNKDTAAINAAQRRKVFNRHQELRAIEPDVLIGLAVDDIEHPTYERRLTALLLLTGRRPVELAMSGELEPIAERPFTMLFSGQAKGKTVIKESFEIPVLIDAERIADAVASLREHKHFGSAAEVNNRIGKSLTDAVDKVFGPDVFTPRSLRQIYATVAYSRYQRTTAAQPLSQPAYFASILGHERGDIQTALSYVAFYVDGKMIDTMRAFRRGLPDLEESLEQRRAHEDLSKSAGTRVRADIAEIRSLEATVTAPARSDDDKRVIARLSRAQRALLRDLLAGGERSSREDDPATVGALVLRELVVPAISGRLRLRLSSDGERIALQLAALYGDRLERLPVALEPKRPGRRAAPTS